MIREDIPLYKLDLEGNSTFNKVTREFMFRRKVKNNSIVIPSKGPFYQTSMRLFDVTGKPLVEGTHYEFYGIMSKITQFTGKPVGLYIRLLDDSILEWYATYQVVGNFSKISNEILNMLKSIHEDDRFVLWENIENKPLWFIPEIHQQDLAYDIYAFTDLARELNRLAEIQGAMTSAQDFMVETLKNNLNVYIGGYKKVLMDLLNSHIGNKHDAHGTDAKAIGLGNVQNIPSATLEETLEGLRDDLTLTPYNAFLAVKAAAGRNERLYPSGTLPILRYGSDTFIPPTIDGSFEGLGGLTRRVGAIVETDGTLLILQHRNNGKVRGLYFTRCADWRSQQANYEFTAYRYTHPTADAAGATLDTIINGSNRYIMVVGDSVKNLWWWCETHGTFDPAKHILVPLTGTWVTDDMTTVYPGDASWERPWIKAILVADKNYREHFAIMQPFGILEYGIRRPGKIPSVPNLGELCVINNYMYTINVVSNRSSKIVRANVTYHNPLGETDNDVYWVPYKLVTEPGDSLTGLRVKSYFAEFTPAAGYVWSYRAPHAVWMKTDEADTFGLRLDTYRSARTPDTLKAFGGYGAFRAKLKITVNGNQTNVELTPQPGSERLYNVDIATVAQNTLEYPLYRTNVMSDLVPNGTDSVGSVWINKGMMCFADGYLNISFPSRYNISNAAYAESWQKLITPPATQPGVSPLYTGGDKVVNETNPVGLGTLFQNQVMGLSDMDDYRTGGVFARQTVESISKWIFRPLGNLAPDYSQVAPTQMGNYQGTTYQNFPFKPEAYGVNLGPQIMLCSPLTVPGVANNKNFFKYIMGVSVETTLMGTYVAGATPQPNGDGLFMLENSIKFVNNVVTILPVIVVNVRAAVARDLASILATSGLTAKEVSDTFSIGRAITSDGNVVNVAQAWGVRGPEQIYASVVVNVTGTGAVDNSKGYAFYNDCSIVARSNVVFVKKGFGAINQWPVYHNYTNSTEQNPRCISIPYKAINGGVMDKSSSYAFFTGGVSYNIPNGNYSPICVLELNSNATQIKRMEFLGNQTWGSEAGYTACPYYGIGDALKASNTFEGAAIGCETWLQDGDILNNISQGRKSSVRVIGMSNILTPQYTVYFQEMKNVMLAGRMYDIPATHIDILDQDPIPANKTYYVYLYYTSGLAKYIISDTVRPESASQSLIATVRCGPTQIDQIIPYNRFSIDGASFSAVRQGSSILASSGSVYDTGDTSAILKPSDYIP